MFNFPYHNRHENQHHWQWLLCFVIMGNIQFGTHISKALLYSKCNLHTYCYVWHSIHAFVFKVFVNKAWLSKYNITMCSCVHTFHILLLQMVDFVVFFFFPCFFSVHLLYSCMPFTVWLIQLERLFIWCVAYGFERGWLFVDSNVRFLFRFLFLCISKYLGKDCIFLMFQYMMLHEIWFCCLNNLKLDTN